MAEPPVFQRSPRLQPPLPSGQVEIPAPPPAPTEPSMSALSVVLSLVPGLLGAMVMYFFSRRSASYLVYSLPMMAVGYLVQLGHFAAQKRKYLHDTGLREQRYRKLLQEQREALERARSRQQEAMRLTDPSTAECEERAVSLDAALWERSSADNDFLALRLGLGAAPFGLALKLPRPANALDADPLMQEAQALGPEFQTVPGVPIRLGLKEAGVAGLAGPRTAVLSAARAALIHLAAHHAPDEVKLAIIFPAEEADHWAWVRWLPHVWTADGGHRYLACDREGAARALGALQEQLARRRLAGVGPGPALVCVVADRSLAEEHSALSTLLREGAGLGAYTLMLAGRKEELPRECQAIAEIDAAGGRLIQTAAASAVEFLPDSADAAEAEAFARALAPVRLGRLAAPAAVPAKVTLLDVLGVAAVEELAVMVRWRASEPFRSLAVPLGLRAGGERLVLDLHERAHGPHGLAAGATGSGKSELLQSLIAGLAANYHPHEVAFLLVDYKGGGMANAFRGLPHLVGTITNLEGSLSRRALAALKAELKRRQRLLGEAGVTHVDEYISLRRRGREGLEPLPHLLVVVDEFAELKAEQPDFMRELVSAVRVGRSLGVHLLLATQKPAGVVDEQIWSNTRFRLCLRVERPEDSQEVLRRPDASVLAGAGRAYLQVGNNERFELFQAAWGGAPYLPNAAEADDPYAVAEVGLDGRRYPFTQALPAESDVTQLEAVVAHLQREAEKVGVTPVQGPWLPPLPEAVALEEVWAPGGRMEACIGLLDDPENQRQEPLRIALGKDGHLAVFGAPGSGKSTMLQTMVLSLALGHSPADLHVYLVDGSGRGFGALAALPQVGAVIAADESERVMRLMRFLAREMELRKARFARLGVSTLPAYTQAGGEPLPAMVVAIDNYPALTSAYEFAEDSVAQIAREGGNLGIHMVLTAGSPTVLRHRVASNITMSVTLSLADRGEYAMAVGRTAGLEPSSPPGRALVKGAPPLEFQTALPVGGETEWERAAALKALCEQIGRQWTGPRPAPIKTLPEVVALAELPAGAIGLEAESLEPLMIDLAEGPHFVITGSAGGGKTTLLKTWLERLADAGARVWETAGADAEAVINEVAAAVQERKASGGPPVVVAIDDYDLFRTAVPESVKSRLEEMVRRERGNGLHLLVAGPSGVFTQYGYEGLTRALLELQTGFVLGSTEHGDIQVLGLRLSGAEAGKRLPPGQGYYVRRGRGRAIKAAVPAGAEPMAIRGA